MNNSQKAENRVEEDAIDARPFAHQNEPNAPEWLLSIATAQRIADQLGIAVRAVQVVAKAVHELTVQTTPPYRGMLAGIVFDGLTDDGQLLPSDELRKRLLKARKVLGCIPAASESTEEQPQGIPHSTTSKP